MDIKAKMDPAKREKSIILNPHLWSLKKVKPLASTRVGRPRKNLFPKSSESKDDALSESPGVKFETLRHAFPSPLSA